MTVRKRTGLDKKVIGLKAGQVGLDTGTNPQLVDQSWLKVENARWTKKGAITKRFGLDALPASYSDPHAAVYKGDLVVLDRAIKAFEGDAWSTGVMRQADTLAIWSVIQGRHAVQQGVAVQQPNTARIEAARLEVRCSQEINSLTATNNAVIRSYNTTSGQMIAEETLQTGASAMHTRLIVALDTLEVFCFYIAAAGGAKLRYRIVTAAGAISAEVNTGLVATSSFQLDVVSIGGRVFQGIARDAAGASVRIMRVDANTLTYTSTTEAIADADAVACWLQSPTLWVGAYFDRTTLRIYVTGYNLTDLTQTFAPFAVGGSPLAPAVPPTMNAGEEAANMTGIALSAATGYLFYTWYDGGTLKPQVYRVDLDFTVPAIPVDGGFTKIQGKAQIISKPWLDRGLVSLCVTQPDALDCYIIDLSGLLAGKALIFSSASNNNTNDWGIADTILLDQSGGYLTSAARILDEDGDTIAGASLEISNPDQVESIETEEALIIGGSLPQYWDGVTVVELGYLLQQPEDPTVANPAVAVGAVDQGQHFYLYTYQWYDAKNLLHESAPSSQVTINVGAPPNSSVVLTCPCLHNTNKPNVRIAIYRTLKAAAATTTMYLVGTRTNSLVLDTVDFTDLLSDAVVSTNSTLYTTGAVLENAQPPLGEVHCLHQSRHFVVDAERPDTLIRYSKVFSRGVSNLIAPEHSDTLVINIPPEGGAITALASFYDSLIAFKVDRAYRVTGTGLSAFGLGRGYSEPYLVSEAVGCIKQKSLVELPGALAFLAPTGLHQLSTKFAVAALGDQVRHFTEAYTYRSGALLPGQHAAAWVSDGLDAPVLVYDYLYGLWSTWTNGQAKDCATVDGELAMVGAGAAAEAVRGQTLGAYTDGGISPTTTLESGIFNFAGLAAFQRLYSLLVEGYSLDDFRLLVAFQYDNDPEWKDEQELDTVDLDAFEMGEYYGAGSGSYNEDALLMRALPYRQRITSFRVRIRDAEQTGQSFTFTGMAAVVGLLNREMRLGPRRSAS